MKKYLMMGVAALALASCSHDDIQFAQPPVNPNPTKAEQYQTAFVSTFGVPAATQTWGFNQGRVMSAPGRRTANPEGNLWESQGYVIPSPITKAELDKVLAVFNKPGAESYEALVDWDCFFVQQVYKGTKHYTAGNGGDVLGSDHMDYLCAYDPVGFKQVVYWEEYNYQPTEIICHDDHVNDFNNSDNNDYDGCMLMVNSSTRRFGFNCSEDGKMHYTFRMEQIDGNYYVGLDFEGTGQNPNQQIARDYIYNDWIVKIVPGKGESVPVDEVIEQGRIICEDLGTIGDFDFNDVVFDAKVWKSGKTEITLLAAGGTLELSVAGKEVHEAMLGAENAKKGNVYKMINTGADTTAEPYYFVAEEKYYRLIDIPILVKQTDAAGNVTSYSLEAATGMAPQKICVPYGFKWCKERKSLAETYPGFKEWTTGAASTWAGEYKAEDVYETVAK